MNFGKLTLKSNFRPAKYYHCYGTYINDIISQNSWCQMTIHPIMHHDFKVSYISTISKLYISVTMFTYMYDDCNYNLQSVQRILLWVLLYISCQKYCIYHHSQNPEEINCVSLVVLQFCWELVLPSTLHQTWMYLLLPVDQYYSLLCEVWKISLYALLDIGYKSVRKFIMYILISLN